MSSQRTSSVAGSDSYAPENDAVLSQAVHCEPHLNVVEEKRDIGKTRKLQGHPQMPYLVGVLVLLLSVGLGLWQFHWVEREAPKTWLKEHLPKGEPHLNVVEEKRDIGKTRKFQSHVGAITASDEALRDELIKDAPENDAVLSQAVHSDRNYAVILRRHVSSKAAVRGRALLELLGFDTAEIDTFYANNPSNVAEAVHVGLLKWVEREPPKTWKVLTEAMKDADIAQQHVEGLKEHLLKGEPHLNVVEEKRDIGKTRKLQSHVGAITANDEALRDELIKDAGGYRTDIYFDIFGNRIVGIGHLILPRDPEHGKPIGTRVTDARVQELLTQDINIALADCQAVFPTFSSLPDEAQRIIANMMFNVGRTRFETFRKLIAAVNARDWSKAAVEMEDSNWFWQVRHRAKRLVRRMQVLVQREAGRSIAAGTSNSGL